MVIIQRNLVKSFCGPHDNVDVVGRLLTFLPSVSCTRFCTDKLQKRILLWPHCLFWQPHLTLHLTASSFNQDAAGGTARQWEDAAQLHPSPMLRCLENQEPRPLTGLLEQPQREIRNIIISKPT